MDTPSPLPPPNQYEPRYSLGAHMRPPRRRRWPWVAALLVLLFAAAVAATIQWYYASLEPRDPDGQAKVFTVAAGDSGGEIAGRLETQGLIRNRHSFQVALRLSGREASIKVGSYRLSPAEHAMLIIEKLESGEVDVTNLQVSPGVTLDVVKSQFVEAGFSKADVDSAFNRSYDHPLLRSRPAGATLEGYVFPDTYQLDMTKGPEAALTMAFDTFYERLVQADALETAATRGLSPHQLITLASMIEKEVSNAADKPHVAQVFLKRLADGMPLGSDVTFMYAARLLGVEAVPTLESPYNTRIVSGLPPGPIANMRMEAIQAILTPATTDDLYFVTGDDGVTHYAETLEAHEANVAQYCQLGCR